MTIRKCNLLLGSLFFALFALHDALALHSQIESPVYKEKPIMLSNIASQSKNKWATKFELQLFPQDHELISSLDSNVENNVLESEKERPNLTQVPSANTVKVNIGNSVKLACVIQSSDTHRLYEHQEWYRGLHTSFDTLDKINDSSRIELKAGGIRNPEMLEIYKVTEKDEGWYTCVVQLNTTSYMFGNTFLDVTTAVGEMELSIKIILIASFTLMVVSFCGVIVIVWRYRVIIRLRYSPEAESYRRSQLISS